MPFDSRVLSTQPEPPGKEDIYSERNIYQDPMDPTVTEVTVGELTKEHPGFTAGGPEGTRVASCALAADANLRPSLKWVVPTEKDVAVARRALIAMFVASDLLPWINRHRKRRRKVYLDILFARISKLLSRFRKSPLEVCGTLKKVAHHFRDVAFGKPLDPAIAGFVLPKFLRNHALRMSSEKQVLLFFQLSYLGRALPMGNSIVQRKALLSFCSLTERHVPSRGTEAHLIVLKSLSTRLLSRVDPPDQVRFSFHSPGATASSTRAEGGFEAEIRSLILPLTDSIQDARRIFLDASKGITTSLDEVQKFLPKLPFAYRTGSTRPLLRDFSSIPFPPRNVGRVVTIPEYGMKARVVQALDTSDVFYGHIHRKRLWPLLESVRQIRTGLAPDTTINFQDCSRVFSRSWYSMDLSNATDTISRDILDEMCLKLGIPVSSVYTDKLQTKSGFVFPVNRGTSMGAPCSWIMLSLIHYAICKRVSRLGGDFTIRGDDLAAYWTQHQFVLYCDLMSQIGFSINLKKSFKHDSMFTFCERLYYVDPLGTAVASDRVVSLRRFSRLPSDKDGREAFTSDRVLSDLPSINGIREFNCSLRVKRALTRLVKRTLPIRGRDFDYISKIPSFLGGFGIFPKMSEATQNLLQWTYAGQGSLFSLSNTLATRASKARTHLEKLFVERFSETSFSFLHPMEPSDFDRLLSKFNARVDLILFLGEDDSLEPLANRSLSSRFSTWVKSIINFSKKVPKNVSSYRPDTLASAEFFVLNLRHTLKPGMSTVATVVAGGTPVQKFDLKNFLKSKGPTPKVVSTKTLNSK